MTAAEVLRAGHSVVLTTGTASGKSLAYLLPIIASQSETADAQANPLAEPLVPRLEGGVSGRRRPATSLYLAPTKALAHDQARLCAELDVPGWRVATVDGDTDAADRQWARDHAHHVLTNPDLVHASLLPNHARWRSFLRSLRYVVVDESHRYRGVFGAQVAAVLRRLRRVAAHYGADPAFAVLSATTAEPTATAAALTGIPEQGLTLVDDDGSPRGPVRVILARSGQTPAIAAAALMAERVRRGEQVLTFVPSRRLAEEVARAAASSVPAADTVVAYRAGYLAADRRVIERGLADGTVRGVAATNALELGVDITGLDTVVLCGYPGSRAAFWQQAGRAGRRGSAADVVLLARPNPLDAYLLDHPEALFDQPVERPVLDPASPRVLGPQLAAAAQELPLRPGDERWFGPRTWFLVDRLVELGLLRHRPDGWYWTSPKRAVDRIDLRGVDAHDLDLVEEATGRVLGTVTMAAVDLVAHPGAVYLHQGDTYLCDGGEPGMREIFVRAARPGYLTQPVVDHEVRPGSVEQERRLGGARLGFGPARVTTTVTGFVRRDEITGQVWDSMPLDCPPRMLASTATTLILSGDGINDLDGLADLRGQRLDAGVHALEHLLTGILPAVLANDADDVGAHSWSTEDGQAVIAVYDRQPGSGFAARAYQRAEAWLAAARERSEQCSCASGCPACILVTGCSSSRPLDKDAARRLLRVVTGSPADRVGIDGETGPR